MQVTILTKEDLQPVLDELKDLRHEVIINRILIRDQYWIPRKTAETLLKVTPNTLKVNADKWGIKYRKGKRLIDYWLPDVVEYLRKKNYTNMAIENMMKAAIAA